MIHDTDFQGETKQTPGSFFNGPLYPPTDGVQVLERLGREKKALEDQIQALSLQAIECKRVAQYDKVELYRTVRENLESHIKLINEYIERVYHWLTRLGDQLPSPPATETKRSQLETPIEVIPPAYNPELAQEIQPGIEGVPHPAFNPHLNDLHRRDQQLENLHLSQLQISNPVSASSSSSIAADISVPHLYPSLSSPSLQELEPGLTNQIEGRPNSLKGEEDVIEPGTLEKEIEGEVEGVMNPNPSIYPEIEGVSSSSSSSSYSSSSSSSSSSKETKLNDNQVKPLPKQQKENNISESKIKLNDKMWSNQMAKSENFVSSSSFDQDQGKKVKNSMKSAQEKGKNVVLS